ncbi:peptidoglycan-binding protein [Streptomyces sp. AcH 505]|uniref:LysM peptidoglycan-binding domain-containing protein n=1 Tax=Streptomyces sp. AcH 505 TaxID=352211 RepID=UPI0005920D99|nr:peptidoglycan-binding protein [Streptomyces sp. AcH 505]
MPKKHRRPRTGRLTRRLIAFGTGGAALTIPLVAATTATAAPSVHSSAVESAVKSAPASVVAAKKAAPTTYSVVSGDSLAKIARTHSLSGGWKKLYQDNRQAVGGNPSLIHPGLKLTLGGKAASRTAATTADRTVPKSAPKSAPKAEAKPATAAAAPSGKSAQGGTSTTPIQTAAASYTNDLDGWIKESLDIMAAHGIPGSYDGIYRNIMRESSGNPAAINNWDSNAAAGTPSKGLLQVIDPTFQAYHVDGTSMDSYDPVANITAACNYAAATYGSIDNVNGPY